VAKYGDVLVKMRQYHEAEEPLTAGYKIMTAKPPSAFANRLTIARQDLITVYTALHQPEKAAKY
jgi:hypothetical protein